MTHVLELSDNVLKAAMIKLFQWALVNMLETKEKIIESLGKEVEDMRRTK